jgi:hypothetical protein
MIVDSKANAEVAKFTLCGSASLNSVHRVPGMHSGMPVSH